MNGRQRAMTAALMDDGYGVATSRSVNVGSDYGRGRGSTVSLNGTPVESLTLLKYIVAEIEAGSLAIRDCDLEIFQEPRYADYVSLNGRYEKQLIQSNQFASIKLEIAPSGQVRDRNVNVNVNVNASGEPYVFNEGDYSPARTGAAGVDGSPGNDDNDIDIEGMLRDDDVTKPPEQRKRAKRAKPVEPAKPSTPAGASAAREIIFDDDGRDPT